MLITHAAPVLVSHTHINAISSSCKPAYMHVIVATASSTARLLTTPTINPIDHAHILDYHHFSLIRNNTMFAKFSGQSAVSTVKFSWSVFTRQLQALKHLSYTPPALDMDSPPDIARADRLTGLGKNVWVEFTGMVAKLKPVNLGQGMPDYPPPSFVVDALTEATKSTSLHQYTRGMGHPRLVNALAALYGKMHGRELDPMSNILVTVGAYSALSHAIEAFVQKGDEVIIIEPFFDCYSSMTQICGGTPVYVPLRPQCETPTSSKDWALDPEELAKAFSERTKMIVVNTPNNPFGKVMSRSELEVIADLCKKHDVLCVSDEVYEWLVYPGAEHVRIATLPGMWERTITISSAGKTFHATGWRTGWAIAPPELIQAMHICLTQVYYTHVSLIQEAIAVGLETELARYGQPDSYLVQTVETLRRKRDQMCEVLREVGFTPIVPEGGYFVLADTAAVGKEFDTGPGKEAYDFQFAKWMMSEKGIASIPPSAFYGPDHAHISGKLIRFCFCKEDATLDAASKLLRQWAQDIKAGKS